MQTFMRGLEGKNVLVTGGSSGIGAALATFWADVFGYPRPEWPEELKAQLLAGGLTEDDLANKSAVEDPEGVGPRLFFQRVPEGKTAKNRMHIDLRATPTFGSVYSEWDWHGSAAVDFRAGLRANARRGRHCRK